MSSESLSTTYMSASGWLFLIDSTQLKTKNPVRGSIFNASTYESKAGPHGGWLYQG